jgi:hypothetical protein
MRRALLLGLLAACAAPPSPSPEDAFFTVHAERVAQAHELDQDLAAGRATVEAFFGEPFRGPVEVLVCADRATFDATFPPEWGVGQTECWMVASGIGGRLALIAPSAWATQACEHDASDADHVRGLLAHELTHCFHGERNPHPDFDGVNGIDWFVEGLATLVSGQLGREHAGVAARAVAAGTAPTQLRDAWTGKDRYGVSGSLVDYVDVRWGRPMLRQLLSATSEAELLAALGTSESELLSGWTEWVKAGAPRG